MQGMKRGVLLLFPLGVVLAAAATGPVWQDKSFTSWTDKDAQAVMTNSPWAKQMPLPISGRPDQMVIEPGDNGAAPPSASLGNPSNTTSGANMTVAGNPGSAGPVQQGQHQLSTTQTPSAMQPPPGAPAQQPKITIIWASATPVRLAVLKLRSNGATPPDAEVKKAQQDRPNYVLAVVGLPAPDGDSDPKALARTAFLSVRGKAPVRASESSYRKIGNSDVYFFHFPRTSLTLSEQDPDVDFRMKMGRIEVKRKFELKTMQYQGRLAL